MQTKILKISATIDNSKTLVTLPDPEWHAAMSDDFTSEDWTMFSHAKSAIRTHGAAYNSDKKVWVIANNRDHSKLVSQLRNVAAHAGWEIKLSKTIRATYLGEGEVEEAPAPATFEEKVAGLELSDTERSTYRALVNDLHANSLLMKRVTLSKRDQAIAVVLLGNEKAARAVL